MESGQVRVARHRISLIEAVERSVAVMTPLFQDKGVKLVSSLDGNECEIVGDLDRACQLIQNLLGNALKFTSASGHVEVNLRQDEAAVSLVVEDTGIGIAPEHLPHIFERFFQVPGGGRGGTGLGLTIVKELVERQGGRIDVRSEPGKGSRFEVMFPRHKPLESEEAHEDSGR
jgi:signal transduction histidine kinase